MSLYLVVEINILSQQRRNGKKEEGAVCELGSGGMKMLTWRERRGEKKGENLQQPSSEQPACDQHLNHS